MSDKRQATFDTAANAMRRVYDLRDVCAAVAVAMKLIIEQLDQIEHELHHIATIAKGGKP